MSTTTTLRPWLGLMALTFTSLAGTSFSGANVNTVERERLLQAATEELDNLPNEIGAWRGKAEAPLSEEMLQSLRCRACQSRTYVNGETGERVLLLLLAGNAGPLVTLAPQACYEGDQLDLADSGQPMKFEDGNEFRQFTLRQKVESRKALRAYFAWRKARGRWEAPQNPRLAFGSQPMLFRLQVATDASAKSTGDAAESDPCRNFLNELLPAIDQTSRTH